MDRAGLQAMVDDRQLERTTPDSDDARSRLRQYRITSERGHHAIALRAVRAVVATRDAAALLQRLDGLRRLRDNALYNNLPIDADEVEAFVPDVAKLVGWLGQAVDHVLPGPGRPSPTSRR